MKLILFSDLHRDKAAAARIVDLARNADVVVGAGDFASVRRDISNCIDVLASSRIPAVLVAGNNESHDELVAACENWKSAHVLHGTSIEIDGATFFGLGGGVPVTPFGSWSWDFSEEDAAQLLRSCPPGAALVSHSPPKGFVDEDSSGRSLGSTASLVRGSSLTAIPQPSWIGKSRWPPARIVHAFSFRQWAGCCLSFYCLVT